MSSSLSTPTPLKATLFSLTKVDKEKCFKVEGESRQV
jgi:hypothetical protein